SFVCRFRSLNYCSVKFHFALQTNILPVVGLHWREVRRILSNRRTDSSPASRGATFSPKDLPMAMAKRKPRVAGREEPEVQAAELLKFYRDMLLIRRFEEKAGQMYGMGLIGGFCHLYIGQEAVVVGVQAAAEPGDTIITSYRDHGHMLATGMDPKGVMAELTGRRGGYSKGKGGSMHMFSRE